MHKSNVSKPCHAFNSKTSIVPGQELPYTSVIACMIGGEYE